MKPIPVLGIPHYNRPDLTARCIASIDYPVDKLVIVLNGGLEHKNDLLAAACAPPIEKAFVVSHVNAGVAGAWNEIIKLFPAPWWLISNNDIQFAPGDLAKLAEAAWDDPTQHVDPRVALNIKGMLYGNHGASWFAITCEGVAAVGLFDENIFPAYLEDCDWSYRADLLGVRRLNVPDVHALHGDAERNITGSTTIHSDPVLREKNHRTHGGNFDYYRCKWGGNNEQEIFKTPFNDPQWPVWAWKFDPAHRAEQQW